MELMREVAHLRSQLENRTEEDALRVGRGPEMPSRPYAREVSGAPRRPRAPRAASGRGCGT